VSTESPSRDPLQIDAEEDALRKKFLEELEAEHADRLDQLDKRKSRAKARTRERREDFKLESQKQLKNEIRDQFYEEHGYVEYVDRSGRRQWVPKEEYEWRMRRRKKSRSSDAPMSNRTREVMFYGLAVLVAVVIGIVFVLKK
jgi:hypothetical protein